MTPLVSTRVFKSHKVGWRFIKSHKVDRVIEGRKGSEGSLRVKKVRESISRCVKICGAMSAQKASSDTGLGNGKLRFLGSGEMPEKVFAFWKLAEFIFSYKLLSLLFWVSLLSGVAEFTFSCKLLDHLFWVSLLLAEPNSHIHMNYLTIYSQHWP